MLHTKQVVCADCETEVVNSNSDRGYKFCPNCTTTRGRDDVKTVYTHCSCCHTKLPQTDESLTARKQAYNTRLSELEQKHEEQPNSGIPLLDGFTELAGKRDISSRELCVDCLQEGCGIQCECRRE